MMDKNIFSQFFTLEADKPELTSDQRDLYRTLHASLSFIPTLLIFISIGFVIIYVLGVTGLLDQNDYRLLIVAGISLVAAILHIPLYPVLRQGKLNDVAAYLLLINGISSASQVLVWQGIVWFPLILSLSPGIVFTTQRGLHRNYRIASFIFSGVVAAIVLYLEDIITYQRMTIGSNLTHMAALAIYITVLTALVVLVLINSRISFRTISGRLVTTFTFVALLSSLATLIIAALANLYYDRQKVFQELNAASAVRTAQVDVALNNLERDAKLSLTDPLIDQRIQYIINNRPGNLTYQINYELVRAFLIRQQTQNARYQEIILLDGTGKAIMSTTESNRGHDFSGFSFFQNALIGINYAIEYNFPGGFDQSSILVVRPFMQSGLLHGAIAARINFSEIKQIMAAQTGIGDTAETYLVGLINGNMVPITNTRKDVNKINTRPAEQAIIERISQGSGIWDNYQGISVLGSYVRIPAIKSVLIAEIDQAEVTQKTVNISLTNAIIGIFTLLLAFAIVLITSRSISIPIVDLAQKATSLANGELSTRIQVSRQDEIGTLASSFNSMAGELQALVKTLEQKIEDRTQDLQKQANYLRVASEVARDATTARNMDELLNNAAQLVLDRFGFYHTGIFLLDERKEYAVLRASPTEAGLEMLSRNHRLKVGQVGIVGSVAASGISRIASDTGLDTAYFNNPLLPKTRSEMALPLRVGDERIGVLDVQSEQSNAFNQDDINILQTMADQLALAIQRVLLTQEQEENLRQLENANQRFTRTSWKNLSQAADFKQGYSFDGLHIESIESFPPDSRASLTEGRSVILLARDQKDAAKSALAVPLKLRDQIIGVLTIQFNTEVITPDTINLIEETASRLAIALENARLYTETQKVAERERAISEVSNRLTTSVNIENILRTTVQEIGRMLPGAEVIVKLEQDKKEK